MSSSIKSAIESTHKALKMQSDKQTIGNRAEDIAKQFLQDKGLKFIQQQYQTKMGEIDLIMKDKQELVFIEVRYRENTTFGEPYETVNRQKQQRLIRTAQYYLQYQTQAILPACRFDIVSISGSQLTPKITWIPNAFGVE